MEALYGSVVRRFCMVTLYDVKLELNYFPRVYQGRKIPSARSSPAFTPCCAVLSGGGRRVMCLGPLVVAYASIICIIVVLFACFVCVQIRTPQLLDRELRLIFVLVFLWQTPRQESSFTACSSHSSTARPSAASRCDSTV